MTRALRPLALATLVALAGACAGIHHFRPNFYSVSGDIRLGQSVAKEIEPEITLLRHHGLVQLVGSIGSRLERESREPAFGLFPYSFQVIDDPDVNAFSLPGGPVYVNSGLIELCDTEDQLAAIVAHEMSHVAARHATHMVTTQNLTQLALMVAVSVIPVPLPPIAWEGAKLGYVLALLSYSRGMESEADELGLRLMYDAGYDPQAMGDVFEKLAEQQRSLPSVVERFVSSHPLNADRLHAARQAAAALPPRPGAPVVVADASAFSQVQAMFTKD